MLSQQLRLGGLLLATALVAPSTAHDDDPKILDRQRPVNAPAYRSATARPGGIGPGGSGGGTINGFVFDSDGVNLEAWLPLNQLDGASSGNDCWGYVSPSGREYALMGTSSSTVFVEVTNPGNPNVVAVRSGPGSLWRDVKTYQNYAYSVSEGGNGIQVFDLSNIDNGNVPLVNTVTTGGTTATHNVAIDETSGYLYRLGGDNNGARIYSLANPASPNYVGSWSSRYIHDAQVVTHPSGPYAGREIMYACGGLNGGFDQTGLTIVDVTNKNSPQVLSQSYYPNPGYSHQGWLSPDLKYFYLGDELDETGSNSSSTMIFNVEDPANPSYVGKFENGNTAVTHNLYTQGDLIFAANYRSGLRIYDASNPTNLSEVAFFDTYDGSDSAEFNGLWSVYPYFPSGTIIGSDLERGLFVWSLDEPTIDITLPGGVPELLDPNGDSVAVSITETNPGDLQAGTEFLAYDIGSGFTFLPLSDLGGGSYDAVFPAIPCGSEVAWYVQANDTNGKTFTNPAGAPTVTHESIAALSLDVVVSNEMETNEGWTLGNTTASTGAWTRVNPIGTAAQPEDDHTPSGTRCWVTGQGSSGGSVGENDVDGGFTMLLSPVMDLSGFDEPTIRYWRWFSNDQGAAPNEDVFRVHVSGNGGSSWTLVEVVGPSGPESSGGWYQHSFKVSDFVTPGAAVQVRFRAADEGDGSIVEAAVDDFEVIETVCEDNSGPGDNYCVANVNSTGLPAAIGATGSEFVVDNDLTLIATQMPPNKFGYFLTSQTQGLVFNPGGSQGILCLGGTIVRYAQSVLSTGSTGEFSLQIDLTNIPPPHNAPVMAGETWNFQTWYRDNNPDQTSNFSDGLSITFQ